MSDDRQQQSDFVDLLQANERYAETFDLQGFDGVARAGVAMVTCMDSRIAPLHMIGLSAGDAKILRNPGGRVTDAALTALILAVNLLGVDRILIVQHTRCAVASSTADQLRERLTDASGVDASWMSLPVITDRERTLESDAIRVRTHPLVAPSVKVGGFMYDVDTGRLDQLV